MLKLITKSGNFGSLNEQTFTEISVRNWEIVAGKQEGRERVKRKGRKGKGENKEREEGKTFFALEDTQTLVWKMGS